MNAQEVEELLATLQDHYDELLNDTRIDRWERVLATADPVAIEQAADRYIAEQPRFFPKPAELVKLASEIVNSHAGRQEDRPRGYTLGDMSPEDRATFMADMDRRNAAKQAEIDAMWPPDQYPGRGPMRFLYPKGRLTPAQRETFEATLAPEQRLPPPIGTGAPHGR